MMEVWEYVMKKTEKGDLMALDFLDYSAGFDSMVHLYIIRKMEIHFGMSSESVEWLKSYLEGWIQYTVVEALNSTPRRMKNGVPQGGDLSPISNDLPEAGLRKQNIRRQEREQNAGEVQPGRNLPLDIRTRGGGGSEEEGEEVIATVNVLNQKVDSTPEDKLTTEERLEKDLRRNGK